MKFNTECHSLTKVGPVVGMEFGFEFDSKRSLFDPSDISNLNLPHSNPNWIRSDSFAGLQGKELQKRHVPLRQSA